jgi:hypothetical protein
MAIGEFTKQIAQQAILSATSKEPAPTAAPQPENPSAVLLGQVAAMQKALKEDEELVVSCQGVRVVEIFAPSRQMVVLTGHDSDRTLTRIIAGVESLQLICKVSKVQAGGKALRVGLVTPKPKDSNG